MEGQGGGVTGRAGWGWMYRGGEEARRVIVYEYVLVKSNKREQVQWNRRESCCIFLYI